MIAAGRAWRNTIGESALIKHHACQHGEPPWPILIPLLPPGLVRRRRNRRPPLPIRRSRAESFLEKSLVSQAIRTIHAFREASRIWHEEADFRGVNAPTRRSAATTRPEARARATSV